MMTAQRPDTHTHNNKGSFWLGSFLGLLLIVILFLVVLVLLG